MKKLIATYPILYLSGLYEVGTELPANDPTMVQAWLDAETAVWKDVMDNEDDSDTKESTESETSDTKPINDKAESETPPAFATPVAAEAGLAGDSLNAETKDNLVGQVQKTQTRNRNK